MDLLPPQQKLLPKPTWRGYVAETVRDFQKLSQYGEHHKWIVIGGVFAIYGILSFMIVPRIYTSVSTSAQDVQLGSSDEIVQESIDQPTNEKITKIAPSSLPKRNTPTPTATLSPLPIPNEVPSELIIPKLKIHADVEQVGQTKTYEMDVPKNAAHVAWYVYGAKPGEEGNAVINGHFDTPSGKPAVFYNLRNLELGDEVTVVQEDGGQKIFTVTGKESIPYDKFPAEFVFHTKPGKNLNLITCDGIWNVKDRIYNHRLVIYTTLKDGGSDS